MRFSDPGGEAGHVRGVELGRAPRPALPAAAQLVHLVTAQVDVANTGVQGQYLYNSGNLYLF